MYSNSTKIDNSDTAFICRDVIGCLNHKNNYIIKIVLKCSNNSDFHLFSECGVATYDVRGPVTRSRTENSGESEQ